MRSFIIAKYSNHYYFIHKSFQEYYVARRIFKSIILNEETAGDALNEPIPVEISTFLKDMLISNEFSQSQRARATSVLIAAYNRYSGQDTPALCIRQNASYYLARIGTNTGIKFLENVIAKEPNKWVQRGIIMGLVIFCNQSERLEQYVKALQMDAEAASINVGYHLCYYGDQPFEEGYYDNGGARCDGTVRAIIRHLSSEKNRAAWSLDLFTLRSLLLHPNRGFSILDLDPSYCALLKTYVSNVTDQDSETLKSEKKLMLEYLEGLRK